MAENQVSLFHSVLTRVIESFSSPVTKVLVRIEKEVNSDDKNPPTAVIEQICESFPRTLERYVASIETVCTIAGCNPDGMGNYLAGTFLSLFSRVAETPFARLQNINLSFIQGNSHEDKVIKCFGLFLTTDMICQMASRYQLKTSVAQILRCGIELAYHDVESEKVHRAVLKQWGVIWSLLSVTEFDEIIKVVGEAVQERKPNANLLFLLRFLRLDKNEEKADDYLRQLLQGIKEHEEKGTLGPELMDCFRSTLKLQKQNVPVLKDIFEWIWSVKEKPEILSQVQEILAILYTVIEEETMKNQILEYFDNEFKNGTNTLRAVRVFSTFMSGAHPNPDWICWEWGENKKARQLEYVTWLANDPKTVCEKDGTCADNFVKYFFESTIYEEHTKLFQQLLVHLAGIDFNEFVSKVVSKFVTLDYSDPRFVTFLTVVPVINSDEFLKEAQAVTKEDVDAKINSLVRERLHKAASIFDEAFLSKHGVCKFEDNKVLALIEDADMHIGKRLVDWNMADIERELAVHQETLKRVDRFSVETQFVNCFQYLIHSGDLTDDLMLLLLKLSFNIDDTIASTAYKWCLELVNDENLRARFASVIIGFLREPTSCEALHVCISLLHKVLVIDTQDYSREALDDMQFVAIKGLASIHPSTRHLAWQVLCAAHTALGDKGFLSFVEENIPKIENMVKIRAQTRIVTPVPKSVSPPTRKIKFHVALYSHYYELWLLFLQELIDILVSANYTPILSRLRTRLDGYFTKLLESEERASLMNVGLLMLYLASYANSDALRKTTVYYVNMLYEPFNTSEENNGADAVAILEKLFATGKDWAIKYAFLVAQHCHITLYPFVINVLTQVKFEQMPEATRVLAILMRSPNLASSFARDIIYSFTSFSASLRGYLTSVQANGPRIMGWTPEMEEESAKHSAVAINYCIVISSFFRHLNLQVTDDEWALSSRELVFRFMMNWSSTTLESLESVRAYAADALVAIIHIGPLFGDSVLFDDSSMEIFSRIELRGMPILSFLLDFHVELLLDLFIDACFKQPSPAANVFFDAIFMALEGDHLSYLHRLTGPILLLGLVYRQKAHPRANDFLLKFVSLVTRGKFQEDINAETFQQKLIKEFSFATESVLETGFKILRMRTLHVDKKYIIEAMGMFIENIRLLPKQSTCTPGVNPQFSFFTPYMFLEKLMNTTETIGEDNFATMAGLWAKLMQSPDHSELVPLFIMSWPNPTTKQDLMLHLIASDAPNIVKRLAQHCSFAYYYHVTNCLGRDFGPEMWVVPLITEAFKLESEELVPFISMVVHFAFLWADGDTRDLLQVLCRQFSIELIDGPLTPDILVAVVIEMVEKLGTNSEVYLEYWGTEALKWLFGCQSLTIATASLTIYNQILRPVEPLVIAGVCKAITFHIVNSSNDVKSLTRLVHESFNFYCAVFQGNEEFAFDYSSTFLDCRVFVETCLAGAANLFLKCLTAKATSSKAWKSIIGIIRPLLPLIESDEHTQRVFDLLITKSKSEELMMVVAPVKRCHNNLFPSLPPFDTLINGVSESTMCKSLSHYSAMLDTASSGLLDAIYELSAKIVRKVVNENNRNPLAKIYKSALNNLSSCANAIDFVCSIAKNEPSVATKSVYEFYEWDRSLEDVCRSLGRLLDADEGKLVTLTDCSTVQSVYNLLNCDVVPKIRPFAAQQEMLEGMMKITRTQRRTPSVARRMSQVASSISTMPAGMPVPRQFAEMRSGEYGPLNKPIEVLRNDSLFNPVWNTSLMDARDFLDFGNHVT